MPQQRYPISFLVLYVALAVAVSRAEEPSEAESCAFQHWKGPVVVAL
jgi:hypothetical protein